VQTHTHTHTRLSALSGFLKWSVILGKVSAAAGDVTVIFGPRQHSLITVLIHNSGHFGPLYRFGPLAPGIAGAADG